MRLILQNFRSYDNFSITFAENELHLLRGDSGKGKSTLFNAIVWCLYDAPKRNISGKEKKLTSVTFETDSIMIYRQKGPGLLRVTKDDLVYENSNAENFILTTFGTYDIFMTTSYLVQGCSNHIFSLTGEQKLKTISQIFNIEDPEEELEKFVKYEKELQQLLKEHESALVKIEAKLDTYDKKVIARATKEKRDIDNLLKEVLSNLNAAKENEKIRLKITGALDEVDKDLQKYECISAVSCPQEINVTPEEFTFYANCVPNYTYNEQLYEQVKRQEQQYDLMVKTLKKFSLPIEHVENRKLYLKEELRNIRNHMEKLTEYNRWLSLTKQKLSVIQHERYTIEDLQHAQLYEENLEKCRKLNIVPEERDQVLAQKLQKYEQMKLDFACHNEYLEYIQDQKRLSYLDTVISGMTNLLKGYTKEQLWKAKEQELAYTNFEKKCNQFRIKAEQVCQIPQVLQYMKRKEAESKLVLLERRDFSEKIREIKKKRNAQELCCPHCHKCLTVTMLDGEFMVMEPYKGLDEDLNKLEKIHKKFLTDQEEVRRLTAILEEIPILDLPFPYVQGMEGLVEVSKPQISSSEIEADILHQESYQESCRLKSKVYSRNFHEYTPVKAEDLVKCGKDIELLSDIVVVSPSVMNSQQIQQNIDYWTIVDEMATLPDFSNYVCPDITKQYALQNELIVLENLEIVEKPNENSATIRSVLDSRTNYEHIASKIAQLPNEFQKIELFLVKYKEFQEEKKKYHEYIKRNDVRNSFLEKQKILQQELSSLPIYEHVSVLEKEYDNLRRAKDERKIYTAYLQDFAKYDELYTEQESVSQELGISRKLQHVIIDAYNETIEDSLITVNIALDNITTRLFRDSIKVTISTEKENKNGTRSNKFNIQIFYKGREFDSISGLSGGESDRVSLAITLAFASIRSSPILMIDESLSSLDSTLKDEAIDVIHEFCSGKIGIVVLHDAVEGDFDKCIDI